LSIGQQRSVTDGENLTKFYIPWWKTKRRCFAALLAAVSVVVSNFSAVSMSFSTTIADLFFARVERRLKVCMAGEVTFEPSSVVAVSFDDIGDW
jgi:uncharacterized hydantoinase/oxoprolinase family protein